MGLLVIVPGALATAARYDWAMDISKPGVLELMIAVLAAFGCQVMTLATMGVVYITGNKR